MEENQDKKHEIYPMETTNDIKVQYLYDTKVVCVLGIGRWARIVGIESPASDSVSQVVYTFCRKNWTEIYI